MTRDGASPHQQSRKKALPSSLDLDHFQLYGAKEVPGTPKFQPLSVNLVDQFGAFPDVEVQKPERLGTPTDKNGEGVLDGESHLTCYKVKLPPGTPKLPNRVVETDDQFGQLTLKVSSKPKMLCVPSLKTVLLPLP